MPTRYSDGICAEALDLLENRSVKLTYAKIAEEADLTEGWVRAFARSAITNPGVRSVEKLITYLNDKK